MAKLTEEPKMIFGIVNYGWGVCAFCGREDRPILRLVSPPGNGNVDGDFCQPCVMRLVKTHAPEKEEQPPQLTEQL